MGMAQITFDEMGGGSNYSPYPITDMAIDSGATMEYNPTTKTVDFACTSSGYNANVYFFYVDVTNVSKVKAKVTINTTHYSYTNQRLALASTKPTTSLNENILTSTPIPKSVGTQTMELDVSSYSGKNYIELNVTEISGTIDSIELI